METKYITSINPVDMTDIFFDKVILEIKQKWPVGSKPLIIQQDNNKPHTTAADNAIV